MAAQKGLLLVSPGFLSLTQPMAQHSQSLEAIHLSGSWLTIGVFDGVHRGHQKIIQQLTAGAHSEGAPAVLLSFSPHPAKILAGRDIPCITTPDERAELLFELGVDYVITLDFTRQLSERSAEDFMADLKKHLGLKRLLMGYDFALGKNRAGNVERLTQIGRELDYQTQVFDAFPINGEIISSTLIRQMIADGNVAGTAVKLGRYYSAQGPVIPGDGRGRTIGIPTANVDIPTGKAIPANGVYACFVLVEGTRHMAAVNIGLRPTFTGGNALPRIEAHLLDFNTDLYGKTVTVEFVERLRGEQKFTSVDELIAQIRSDVAQTREILRTAGA